MISPNIWKHVPNHQPETISNHLEIYIIDITYKWYNWPFYYRIQWSGWWCNVPILKNDGLTVIGTDDPILMK